jgi:hypothetical protein
VPIKTWAQTLGLASKGVAVYLWTAATGKPVPTSLAELKALEHTGTHAFPQFTTYTRATGGGSSTPRWVNPGGVEVPSGSSASSKWGATLARDRQAGVG